MNTLQEQLCKELDEGTMLRLVFSDNQAHFESGDRQRKTLIEVGL